MFKENDKGHSFKLNEYNNEKLKLTCDLYKNGEINDFMDNINNNKNDYMKKNIEVKQSNKDHYLGELERCESILNDLSNPINISSDKIKKINSLKNL